MKATKIVFHGANTAKIIIIFINYLIKTPFKYFNCKINPFSGIFINKKFVIPVSGKVPNEKLSVVLHDWRKHQ